MSEKKNYLDNAELKEEILRCITEGYNRAVSLGYQPHDWGSSESEPAYSDNYGDAVKLGYMAERSEWINTIRNYDQDVIEQQIKDGEINKDEANVLMKQMEKPLVSDKLGRMFQLMVENVARSFYWQNPDDGLDCKANALLDLCSNFWKFEPADPITGKPNSAFAFCTQIAYFGIAGAHRILHPKKYDGTISMSCLSESGKLFELYNL